MFLTFKLNGEPTFISVDVDHVNLLLKPTYEETFMQTLLMPDTK